MALEAENAALRAELITIKMSVRAKDARVQKLKVLLGQARSSKKAALALLERQDEAVQLASRSFASELRVPTGMWKLSRKLAQVNRYTVPDVMAAWRVTKHTQALVAARALLLLAMRAVPRAALAKALFKWRSGTITPPSLSRLRAALLVVSTLRTRGPLARRFAHWRHHTFYDELKALKLRLSALQAAFLCQTTESHHTSSPSSSRDSSSHLGGRAPRLARASTTTTTTTSPRGTVVDEFGSQHTRPRPPRPSSAPSSRTRRPPAAPRRRGSARLPSSSSTRRLHHERRDSSSTQTNDDTPRCFVASLPNAVTIGMMLNRAADDDASSAGGTPVHQYPSVE